MTYLNKIFNRIQKRESKRNIFQINELKNRFYVATSKLRG